MSLFRKNNKSFPETGAPEPRKNPGRSLFAGRPGPFAALLVLSALFLAIPTLVVPGLRAPGLFGSGIFGSGIFGSGIGASDPETAGPEAAGEPRGVLALPMSRDHFLNNLDPASWNGPLVLHMLLYEGLLEEGPDNSVLPSLAESWEISEDGLEYSFRLKEGVKFSDGTPFDAGAAIFNLKRWVNDDMFSSLESHRVESMEETGPFGLKIRFKEAADTILRELAYPRPVRFVAPDHVVVTQDNPKGRVPFPIGTGPFMVESFTLEEFALVPNPHYHGKKPKIAKLEFKVIKDGQARVMALRNGELDIAGGLLFASLPLESLKKLREDSRFRTCLTPSLGSVFMAFNNDSGKFDDHLLRRAVSQSIDRNAISEVLFDGQVGEATGLFQNGVPYATKENNFVPPHDPKEAEKLFAKAGYLKRRNRLEDADGRPLRLTLLLSADENPEWKILGEYAQASLAEAGITVSLKLVGRNLYYETLSEHRDEFDLVISRTYSDLWMPHGFLAEFFGEIPGKTVSKFWTDPEMRDLVRAATREMDADKRKAMYDEVMTRISGSDLTVPLYFQESYFFARKDSVGNFAPGASSYNPVDWLTLEAK